MVVIAFAETAHLVAQLDLKDNFTPNANKAMKSLGKLESTAFRVGQNIGKGLKNAATNLRNISVVAAVGIAAAVKGGVSSLAQLEDAESAVTGAIKQTNQTGKLTAKQISGWANEIEASIGAAFDDKEITQSAATLIRFGKVTAANLRPALVVMTDLATKTGSVDSAASLLAKALADPEKAAGKLARTGVILTKEQQAQIKAFVKAGKVGKAQKVILDSLATATKGAAAASQGPYRRSLSVLADVTEDAQRALGIGFLPILEKVSGILSTELAKPETLKNIREFGEGLAGGLDQLIGIVQKLPFAQIGDSLKIAGAGAKAVLSAFTGLPPWVQTAVLTGWGLNKLTGGAIGGIVGELGKGLIKGVLGMNAAVVNIEAGVVNGAGGGVGSAAGGIGALGKVFLVGEAIGLVAAVEAVREQISNQSTVQATAVSTEVNKLIASQPSRDQLTSSLSAVEQGIIDLKTSNLPLFLVQGDALTQLEKMRADIKAQLAFIQNRNQTGGPDDRGKKNGAGSPDDRNSRKDLADKTAKIRDAVESARIAEVSKLVNVRDKIESAKIAQISALAQAKSGIQTSVAQGSAMVAGAVRASRPIVNVSTNVSVTAGNVQKSVTNSLRYGSPNGSHGSRNKDRDDG